MQELQVGNVTGRPVKIAAVFVDYLQALPIEATTKLEEQRRLQVRRDVYRLRSMTTHLEAPVIVGVQAKQKLDGANPPYLIPGTYDGEETSSIAQRFDRILSLWLPKTTYSVGKKVEGYDDGRAVQEDSVWLKINKQRGGFPAGASYHLRVDYQRREFASRK
jgi:replicative DNA helicase